MLALIGDPGATWTAILPHVAPVITATAALIAGVAALRGAQGKRHRNIQQVELLARLEAVQAALNAAQGQRDKIASELAEEQRKCREESALLRSEIERQTSTTNELMKMIR